MSDIKQTIYNIERCTCHVPDACRDCSFSDDKTGVNKDCIDALLCDALDVIKSQQAEIERLQPRWIPVSERLPDDDTDALAYFDNGEETRIVAINYANGVWYDCIFNQVTVFKHITHWMPLPQPPKEGDSDADGTTPISE